MGDFALDRASVRRTDADGRLHVAVNNISKAAVDPYYGREIPGYEALGLDPDRVYHLLRHPEELEKAAATFNNLPILAEHVPVTADEHMPSIVVGSTGTDAAFVAPFLQNSAVIWARAAIDDIETEEKRNWSCAYRYKPDMTPGTYRGLRYDGVMRNIIGNHVALVETGRAGPDVVVGDSAIAGDVMLKSRTALLLQGAFIAAIGPKLAGGSKVDFAGALDSVTGANLKAKTPAIAAAVVKIAKPMLAADAGLEVSDVVDIIGALSGNAAPEMDAAPPMVEEPMPAVDADGDAMSRVMAFLSGKLSDEDMAECSKLASAPAMDGDDDEDDDDEDKDKKMPPAMDAATIRRDAIREVNAIRDAEAAVAPHIGKLAVAMDSAAAVYRLALEAADVDLAGVHPSAFKAMVTLLPAPGGAEPAPRVAMDAGLADDFKQRFPGAATLVRS